MSSASAIIEKIRPPNMRRVDKNVAKATDIGRWLDALGEPARRLDRGAISADLSDLYSAAEAYRAMLDALLALKLDDPDAVPEKINEITGELRHMAWHIRSVTRRLDRLEHRLTPDDE